MPKKPTTNSSDQTRAETKPLESAAGVLSQTPLSEYLTSKDLASLSAVSREMRKMTADARKKIADTRKKNALEQLLSAVVSDNKELIKKIVNTRPTFNLLIEEFALKILLLAVVYGNEDLAKEIIISRPELLQDKSATATDPSGKEIENLTPLQAALCAGDDDMVRMMKEVVPELDILSQFSEISAHRTIDEVKAEQKDKAQKFKTQVSENVFNLARIFAEINAATDAEVQAELDAPGQHKDSQLNAALRNFRQQFDAISNQKIFSPYDLLAAFELYKEQFDNFGGNPDSQWQQNRRRLFWVQVIGYIQRHLPACYLQAFSQSLYYIIEHNKKLERNFEFQMDKGFYIRAHDGDLNNLGYKYAATAHRAFEGGPDSLAFIGFALYCEKKHQAYRDYLEAPHQAGPDM